MKKTLIASLLLLSACGSMGIGQSKHTNVINNSQYAVNVSNGAIIQPHGSGIAGKEATLTGKGEGCATYKIETETNVSAVVLDIFPGLFFGIIPIVVDALTGNLTRAPETSIYNC
jgi:hypothetical protein